MHAAQALATLRAGEEELDALAGLHAGTIHIGASTTPGVYLLPDTLGCFRRDHPNVTVEVEIASTGEIIERLLTGGVQLALVGETQADDRIALDPFLSDELVGIAKPGLLPLRNGWAHLQHSPSRRYSYAARSRAPDKSATRHSPNLASTRTDLGTRLKRSHQTSRSGRPRHRLPLPLRRRRRNRTKRTRTIPTPPQPTITRRSSSPASHAAPSAPLERGFIATLTRCCAKTAEYAAARAA